MTVRLDDIDYFLAVVAQGRVRRAAVTLGVSQPAVTKGIQRLERGLGFPLFERGGHGMALTSFAEQFYERTRALRSTLSDAIREATDLHLGTMGVLRVGVSPLYAQRLFVPACLQLHRQRPAARLVVNVNLNDLLLTALRGGNIDLSLSALPAVVPGDLHAIPLLSDDLCMVVRQGHPLLRRRRLRLPDLVDAQWLLPGPGVAARRSVEALFVQAGLPPPQVAVEVSNTATPFVDLLAQSDLVSLQSLSLLGRIAPAAGQQLVPLPLAEARFPRQIGVLTRANSVLPPLARRFIELLAETSGESR